MKQKWMYSTSFCVVIALSFTLFGCGTSSSGSSSGGTPVAQPIVQNSGSGTSSGNSSSGSGTSTTSSSSSSTKPSGTSSSTSGKSKSATSSSSKSSSTSSSVSASASSITLIARQVSTSQPPASFIAISPSIQTVQVPSGWVLDSVTSLTDGTVVSMSNPADASQILRETIQTTSRDLTGFYNNVNTVQANSASWIVQGKSAYFSISNPNSSYQDRGIVANMPSGGSIRVDLYVPDALKAFAKTILYSFVGTTPTA